MIASFPLMLQSDGTFLLDERHPRYEEALNALRPVSELSKRPGFLHTYRMTPVTLWNAAAAGLRAESVIERLAPLVRSGITPALERDIREQMGRFGRLRLVRNEHTLVLKTDMEALLHRFAERAEVARCFASPPVGNEVPIRTELRGVVKRELAALGFPLLDEAGYRSGESLGLDWRSTTAAGRTVCLRPYQSEAAEAFLSDIPGGGGSGVVVLPCGAGKTWVGMAAMARLRCETLILTPNTVSVSQWIRELLANTTLTENEIGEYTGQNKRVRPVTVATYQVLTYRRSKAEEYPHWKLFVDRDWGLIIYDEVHLLPAPVFRMTADLQATRRLGLTATLVREDGRQTDVFALIGPKRYEMPWKLSEREGWIAKAACTEVRVALEEQTALRYSSAGKRLQHRLAGENPAKEEVVRRLLERHEGQPVLVIGQYLDQLHRLSAELQAPLVTGELPHAERRRMFDRFNRGEFKVLLVSKVANFAVDLPDAAVAIQVSGSFGSRQEEAQRLGRILRPKEPGITAAFYSLVSEGTGEVEFARNRGRFLVEQGYSYSVDRWNLCAVSRPAKGVGS